MLKFKYWFNFIPKLLHVLRIQLNTYNCTYNKWRDKLYTEKNYILY